MSTGEMAYLALVIGSMLTFALTLAWATYVKQPDATKPAAPAPAGALPAL